LVSLNISGNRCFGQEDKTAIESLVVAIAASTTISELNLAGTGIDSDDAKILALAIKAMEALVSLNLTNNSLKALGAKHIAEVLPKW
jgi:hypothetical protein